MGNEKVELRKILFFGLMPVIREHRRKMMLQRDGEEFSLGQVDFQLLLNHVRCQGSSLECRSEVQERALVWRCWLRFISFKMVIKAKRTGGHAHEMNLSSDSQLETILFSMGKLVWSHFWLLKLRRGGTKCY